MKSLTQLRRQLFISLGLTDKEAILYETLLKYGSLPAATLEKQTGLKKNTYTLLKSLERRGLVQKSVVDGRSHYQVGSPTKLKSYLEEKKKAAEEASALFEESLPSLLSDYKNVVNSPVVSHYQGKNGLKEVLELTYKADKKEIYGCVGWGKSSEIFEEVTQKYTHLRVDHGIFTHAINSDSPGGRKFLVRSQDPATLSEVFLVDMQKYPLPAEIDVWNNTISMFSFENDDFTGVIIDHPEFAKTLKSIFTLLFNCLRQLKKNGVEQPFQVHPKD